MLLIVDRNVLKTKKNCIQTIRHENLEWWCDPSSKHPISEQEIVADDVISWEYSEGYSVPLTHWLLNHVIIRKVLIHQHTRITKSTNWCDVVWCRVMGCSTCDDTIRKNVTSGERLTQQLEKREVRRISISLSAPAWLPGRGPWPMESAHRIQSTVPSSKPLMATFCVRNAVINEMYIVWASAKWPWQTW